jgi:hypothetical protein
VSENWLMLNMVDQNGIFVTPVTQTGANAGIAIEDIEATDEDQGEVAPGGDTAVSSVAPISYQNVIPEEDEPEVTVEASSDYGDIAVVVDFIPDFDAPQVGALTAVNCGFTIAITDNKATDCAATVVTVLNSAGEDITDSLTVEGVASDNETECNTLVTGESVAPGTYSVTITATDAAGNSSAAVTKTVTITTCDASVVPSCGGVDPTFASFNETLDVTITGVDTSFVQGTTSVSFGCDGVTVNSTTVLSSTEVVANITVAADAAEGACAVTVTTGPQVIECAFEIVSDAPVCNVSPAAIAENTNTEVTISVENIVLDETAEVLVGTSCSAITVNSATVDAANQTITAQLIAGNVESDTTCTIIIRQGGLDVE